MQTHLSSELVNGSFPSLYRRSTQLSHICCATLMQWSKPHLSNATAKFDPSLRISQVCPPRNLVYHNLPKSTLTWLLIFQDCIVSFTMPGCAWNHHGGQIDTRSKANLHSGPLCNPPLEVCCCTRHLGLLTHHLARPCERLKLGSMISNLRSGWDKNSDNSQNDVYVEDVWHARPKLAALVLLHKLPFPK